LDFGGRDVAVRFIDEAWMADTLRSVCQAWQRLAESSR
jgi:hypothetical protein